MAQLVPPRITCRATRAIHLHSRAVKCLARVVHVQRNAFLGGKAGIGVHIERYEAVAAAGAMKERWTSSPIRRSSESRGDGRWFAASVSAGGYTDSRLGAGDVFKLIVHADRDGMFPGRDFLQLEIIIFAWCIAQAAAGEHEVPVFRVQAVLGPRDGAGGVARLKPHAHAPSAARNFRR